MGWRVQGLLVDTNTKLLSATEESEIVDQRYINQLLEVFSIWHAGQDQISQLLTNPTKEHWTAVKHYSTQETARQKLKDAPMRSGQEM